MQRQLGATTVGVTHDQVEAMTRRDRITVMNQGRVMQADVPTERHERAANVFVAAFIGSPRMNRRLTRGLFAGASASEHRLTPDARDRALPSVRPEHAVLGKDGGDALAIGRTRRHQFDGNIRERLA